MGYTFPKSCHSCRGGGHFELSLVTLMIRRCLYLPTHCLTPPPAVHSCPTSGFRHVHTLCTQKHHHSEIKPMVASHPANSLAHRYQLPADSMVIIQSWLWPWNYWDSKPNRNCNMDHAGTATARACNQNQTPALHIGAGPGLTTGSKWFRDNHAA